MPILHHLAAFAVAALLVPVTASASVDNDEATKSPYSSGPPLMQLCGGKDALIKGDGCKDSNYAQQATELEQALKAALAKAPANIRPLLKRDQYWFDEIVINAVENGVPQSKEPADRDGFADMLSRRIATLAQIAEGFGRPGVTGKWESAFGSVTVTPADGGAYRLAFDTDSGYLPEAEKRWRCKAAALVKPAGNGWLAGELVVEAKKPDADSADKPADGDNTPPRKPLPVKMRRQGETLRVVAAQPYEPVDYSLPESCNYSSQITSTYFASAKAGAATSDKIDIAFVAPTFDCARPNTASEEEICADPDLAAQDIRLNRAWKALLPRLDETTRRALSDDQRNWVREQAGVFPYSLHPGGDKMTYELHHATYARVSLDRLQRERIALLEGFDENRKGLAGLWLSHNAILNVTPADDGGLQAKGWKWDWDDYKAGCDYDMQGKVQGKFNGAFRSDEQRKNPDTLERDHAMLIVNRQDDAFAKKRGGGDGEDEMKCRRSMQASSTARLFPARYSPDIDNTGDWHR